MPEQKKDEHFKNTRFLVNKKLETKKTNLEHFRKHSHHSGFIRRPEKNPSLHKKKT